MARRYVLVDDLDGKESTEDSPVETVEFSYAGKPYTIDLSTRNRTALDKALSRFVEAATEIVPERPEPKHGRRTRRSASPASGPRSETADIRAWAVARGLMAEGSRGRIPGAIQQQYREETGRSIPPAPATAREPEPVAQAS